MSHGGRDAERKVWRTPELVERLLPFLDVSSVERLAECHDLTRELLQRPFTWNKFIKRSISKAISESTVTWVEEEDEEADEDRRVEVEEEIHREVMLDEVKILARILRMLEDDSQHLLLDLLHLICERYAAISFWGSLGNWLSAQELIAVACSCTQTHFVSPLGFLFLDAIEATVGTAAQSVEAIKNLKSWENWWILPVLTRRVVQQEEKVEAVDSEIFSCRNKEMAEVFYALAANTWSFTFPAFPHLNLCVWEQGIGADGWAEIRKGIQSLGINSCFSISSTEEAIAVGRREDLRAIWDCLGVHSSWWVRSPPGDPLDTRLENWEMLEEILDAGDDGEENSEAEVEPHEEGNFGQPASD